MCRVAQKVAVRWLHLALTPALLAWKNLNSQSKRVRGAAQKVVLRWLKSALVVVMDVWMSRWRNSKRLEFTAHKIISRWLRLTLTRAMRAWAARSRGKQDLSAHDAMSKKWRWIGAKWRFFVLKRSLNSWKEHITCILTGM